MQTIRYHFTKENLFLYSGTYFWTSKHEEMLRHILGLSLLFLVGCTKSNTYNYPITKRSDVIDTYHGVKVKDAYRWLEDVDSEETKSWVRNQDSITRSFVKKVEDYQLLEDRYKELIKIRYSDGEPRKANGKYFYYSRSLSPRGIYVKESLNGPSKLVLAESETDPGNKEKGWPIVEFEPSFDGKYLAYGIGKNLSQWNVWRIIDVTTGKHLTDKIEGMYTFHSPLKWKRDNSGFYYSRFDLPNKGDSFQTPPKNQRVLFHAINTSAKKDKLIFSAPDDQTGLSKVYTSSDGKLVTILTTGMNVNDVYVKRIDGKNTNPIPIVIGKEDRHMYVTSRRDKIILVTSKNAPRRKIVEVDINSPSQENWTDLIPEDNAMTINNVNFIGDKIVVEYSKDLISIVKIFSKNGRFEREVTLPYIGWLVSRQSTAYMTCFLGDENDNEAFFGMQTIFDPGSVFRLDVNTGKVSPVFRANTPFNTDDFETKQIFYTSKDGTKVPMYILYKKSKFKKDGSMPAFIYAYGFNWAAKLYYTSVDIIEWMEMGGIYAYPGIRGGSEYGQDWIHQGSGRNKQNAIDDYAYAAKHLINEKYTSKGKVVANGGSASGPLPAAVINQYSDIWGCAIIDIPLTDMIRMYNYQIGPITSGWGDLNNKEDFKSLYKWSPYQNVKKMTYPPVLLTVGELDEQASPMHGYKMIAALQHAQKENTNPMLLQVGWKMRHQIRGRDRINRLAFIKEVLDMNVVFH